MRTLMYQGRFSVVRYGTGLFFMAAVLLVAWPGLRNNLFTTGFGMERFMPHGHCYLWVPSLVWLHVSADLLIGLSYTAISLMLGYLVYRAQRDIPFHWIFLAFGLFIVACGATHFMEVWTLWTATYWLSGYVKLITAAASVVTALVMPPLIPKTLALVRDSKMSADRKRQLETVNREMEKELTERARMQEELRASQARFAGVLAIADDAVILVDKNQRVNLFNQAAERVFGYGEEEVLGQSLDQFLPQRFQQAHHEHFDVFSRSPEVSRKMGERTNIYGRRKDGTEFPAEASISKLELEGEFTYTVMLRDITARKQAEEALEQAEDKLRQSQKLESIGQLAGGIAHDFNNLLTAINGYSELLMRQLDDVSALDKVQEIKKAGERAALMTHQLLAFSRKQILQPVVLDINTAVSDMNKILMRLIEENIQIVSVLEPRAGHVRVDPGQLSQVIMNLTVNARDAMPQGGRLTIETANVDIDEEVADRYISAKPGRYVMLAVSDTGVGMDDETKARVFEPFFTTKEVGKGTGLGLSTVYGIVKQSGGSIWVYSEVGQGTTFKIYLPRVDKERVPTGELEAPASELPRGTETILLVEDEEAVRALVRDILESCGYKVLVATDGKKAVSICKQGNCSIDLLITDVIMPLMGGSEVAKQIFPLQPQMRVLYMSGYADNAIVHHGVLEEDTNFIQKPFTLDALAQKVRDVLDSELVISDSVSPLPEGEG